MPFSLRALALLALALVAAPTFAQDAEPLRPGDVDVSAVQPHAYTYRIFVKQGTMEMPFGSATESLTIEDGVALSTVTVNGAGVSQKDSVWTAWPTLEPIRAHSEANGEVQTFDFSPDAVSGTLRSGDALDVTLDAPVFGPSVGSLIARTLLDDEGATVSYLSFDEKADAHTSLTTLTVGGTEEVMGRTARVVTAEGSSTTTYHFDVDTKELLKFSFSPQPGVTVDVRRSDLEG